MGCDLLSPFHVSDLLNAFHVLSHTVMLRVKEARHREVKPVTAFALGSKYFIVELKCCHIYVYVHFFLNLEIPRELVYAVYLIKLNHLIWVPFII